MDDKEIRDIIDEIRIIKEMVYKDKEVVERFILSRTIRYLSLFFGMFFLVAFWGIYWARVSGVQISEGMVMYLIVFSLVVMSLVAGVIKFFSWKVVDPNFSPTSFIYRILGVSVLKFFVVVITLVVFLSIYLSLGGLLHYLLPTIGIGVGLLYLVYGTAFHNTDLELLSYYLILTSSISIPFIAHRHVEVFLWTGIVFGLGFILFFVFTTVRAKRKGVK
ncbi:MAG: hypothetical protein ABDH28_03390 [Brevinematia bacterium]